MNDDLQTRRSAAAEAHPGVQVVASECDLYGHDYEVREWEADGRSLRIPASVFCPRCGLSWKVER